MAEANPDTKSTPSRVWLVVEESFESQCDTTYSIEHVCASLEGAKARLQEDSAFIKKLAEYTESEMCISGCSGEWFYRYYIEEKEVEP